jgi:hypothetical protein
MKGGREEAGHKIIFRMRGEEEDGCFGFSLYFLVLRPSSP